MENDVPKFLRLTDLQERGVAMTHQAVGTCKRTKAFRSAGF